MYFIHLTFLTSSYFHTLGCSHIQTSKFARRIQSVKVLNKLTSQYCITIMLTWRYVLNLLSYELVNSQIMGKPNVSFLPFLYFKYQTYFFISFYFSRALRVTRSNKYSAKKHGENNPSPTWTILFLAKV